MRRVCFVLVGFVFLAAACAGDDPVEAPAADTSTPAVVAGGGVDERSPAGADESDSDDARSQVAGDGPERDDGPRRDAVTAPAPEDAGTDEEVVELELAEGVQTDQGVVEEQPPEDPVPDPEVAPLHPIERATQRNFRGYEFPPAPDVPVGPLEQPVVETLEAVWTSLTAEINPALVSRLGESGDPRLGWILSDLLRFFYYGEVHEVAVAAFETLTGVSLADDPVAERSPWQSVTDHLIAWDLPAFDSYVDYKERLFTLVEPGWQPFFDDRDANIDWRLVSWGGVRIDDRPLGDPQRCVRGCIPARDDPPVTDAAGGLWYPDDAIVFAVAIGGEARAYPKNFMEIHEMVNDTLGGRRIGFPYCTLCGSAQAYFTDDVPAGVETPILRTSGLLSRSNKVMYDLVTKSVFDTFTGEAVSGPLRRKGVVLNQATVVTTTWGEWKAAHPETTIVARDGGSAGTTPSTPCAAGTTTGPSSRSATWTSVSASRIRSSAWSSRTAPPSRFPSRPRLRPSKPAGRWNSAVSRSASTAAGCAPPTPPATRSRATRRSGSPGASSCPTRSCGSPEPAPGILFHSNLVSPPSSCRRGRGRQKMHAVASTRLRECNRCIAL